MHEYSIIAALFDMCESHAKAHNAYNVAKVHIAIGERSAVDSSLLQSAFDTFKLEYPLCQNATLEIVYQPIKLKCESCGYEFIGEDYGTCPMCQAHHIVITQGRELHLLRLELDIESNANTKQPKTSNEHNICP